MRFPPLLIVGAILITVFSGGALLVPAFVIGLVAIVLADRAQTQAERERDYYKQELEQGRASPPAAVPPTNDPRLLGLLSPSRSAPTSGRK